MTYTPAPTTYPEPWVAKLHNEAVDPARLGPELAPPTVTVEQYGFGVNAEGNLVLVLAGSIERPKTHQPTWTGRINRSLEKLPAQDLVESAMRGTAPGLEAPTALLWSKALELACQHRLGVESLRVLSRGLTAAIGARAGCRIERADFLW